MNRIAALNDEFRKTFRGGRVMLTAGVGELPAMVIANVLCRVASFNEFTEGNDPNGEHDFGSFTFCSRKFIWKIDYYDPDMQAGSEDAADLAKTTRVLTVMLAHEY